MRVNMVPIHLRSIGKGPSSGTRCFRVLNNIVCVKDSSDDEYGIFINIDSISPLGSYTTVFCFKVTLDFRFPDFRGKVFCKIPPEGYELYSDIHRSKFFDIIAHHRTFTSFLIIQ